MVYFEVCLPTHLSESQQKHALKVPPDHFGIGLQDLCSEQSINLNHYVGATNGGDL